MSLVIHYCIGDVQDCQGVSASEMTYIVSSGALNSTHYYWHTHYARCMSTPLSSCITFHCLFSVQLSVCFA